jgi:hypothetical protein
VGVRGIGCRTFSEVAWLRLTGVVLYLFDAAITSLSVASFTARAYMDELPESEAQPDLYDFYRSTLLCGGPPW